MNQENDIQSCRRLLNEIAEMCEHASLTGSLSGGAKRTAQRYNTILQRLLDTGDVPQGLFSAIPEGSDFGEIGVEARMLAAYFPGSKDKGRRNDDNDRSILMRLAPFVGREELALLIREQSSKGTPLDINTISNLAPFLGQDILGELLRSHLTSERQVAPASPKQPEQPERPTAPATPPAPVAQDLRLEPIVTEAVGFDEMLNLLKSPYLSDEERNNLTEKLRTAFGPKD